MSAFDDAKVYLYRYPWAVQDHTNPTEIITGLVREVEELRQSTRALIDHQAKMKQAERKISALIQLLNDLVHSKSKMTHKRLCEIQLKLDKL